MAAIFILLPLGVFAAEDETEAGILPDNPFYFLDSFSEWVKLNIFTWNKEAKVKLMLRYAEEKQKEISTLIEKGKKVEKSVKAIKKETAYLDKAGKKINELKNEGRDVGSLVERLQQDLTRHQENLEGVYNLVPEEAREAIRKVIEKSKGGLERAIEMIQQEKGDAGDIGVLKRRIQKNIEAVKNLLETENGEIKEEEKDSIEVEIKNGVADVKVKVGTTPKEFTLNTTNKDLIVSEIIGRTGLSRDTILQIIKFREEAEPSQAANNTAGNSETEDNTENNIEE